MKTEVQWLLEGIWRQYKVNKFYLKFQGIARRKNAWKNVKNCWVCAGGTTSCALAHGMGHQPSLPHAPIHTKPRTPHMNTSSMNCFLVFRSRFWWKNPIFTVFYSFRKLEAQGKGQTSWSLRHRISIHLLFYLGHVFLLFCNDVGFHKQLNLFE